MKDVQTRVQECISIRSKLQSLGVLTLPEVATTLTLQMNDYVRTGERTSYTFKTHEHGVELRVILDSREQKQSGIEMMK